MKELKLSGFNKFLSLLLIAILVISAVGFAVSGWEGNSNQPDSGEVGNTTDDTDENKDGTTDEENQAPSEDNNDNEDNSGTSNEEPPIPEPEVVYTSKITGLQITEAEYNSIPTGIIVDPTRPLYGVSASDISIEFPIEDGSTRLLTYTTSAEVMWKIGALKATRNYISCMSNFFGGVVISYGNDDKVVYDAWETDSIELDLSAYSDCYYVENTLYVYTTENMIQTAQNRMPTGNRGSQYKEAPYTFTNDGTAFGVTSADTVIIPYTDANTTKLYFHEESGKYLYYKSDNRKMDMLTGKNISFSNVFILFANATTYENSNGTELVMDILSGGKGYYISMGTLTEFIWQINQNGELEFKSLMGEKLAVNRGNAYIAYYKASLTNNISIS